MKKHDCKTLHITSLSYSTKKKKRGIKIVTVRMGYFQITVPLDLLKRITWHTASLKKLNIIEQILVKLPNIKLTENLFSSS
jgi:hypothetical protein